jgi:uncharacterized protein YndB with AHSA1/START domain
MTVFSTRREFTSTPAQVFQAIQEPARLASWWGPTGFSNQFDVFEFREGGRWTFTMIGPDGTRYPNEAVFARIALDRLVVIEHVCEPLFRLTLTLLPTATGTLLVWEQDFADPQVAEAVRHIVEPANEQNLDRLGQALR